MSPALQAKLLQVLQDGQFSRLGGRHPVKVDVRVLAATNINMVESIAKKTFREDLYYRLSSFVLSMPSLRQRREEIPMMLRHFMIQVAERYACPLLSVSPRMVEACENYSWPGISGNWRISSNGTSCWATNMLRSPNWSAVRFGKSPDRDDYVGEPQNPDLKQMVKSLKDGAEMEAIANALEENGWNRKRAATMLNISYKALLYKIRQYDIRPRHAG